MLTFFQKAVETLASTEAKNRGLQGNGHGDWYDAKGNFVAKTVGGKLKYFGAGDTKSVDGKPGEEVETETTASKTSSTTTRAGTREWFGCCSW